MNAAFVLVGIVLGVLIAVVVDLAVRVMGLREQLEKLSDDVEALRLRVKTRLMH